MKKQQNNPSKKRRATNGHNSIIEVPHRKAGGIVKNSKRRQLSNSEQDYMRQLNEAVKRLHTQLMLNRRKRAGYTAMIGQVITPEIVIILRNAVKVFPDEVADKTSKEFSTFVRRMAVTCHKCSRAILDDMDHKFASYPFCPECRNDMTFGIFEKN